MDEQLVLAIVLAAPLVFLLWLVLCALAQEDEIAARLADRC